MKKHLLAVMAILLSVGLTAFTHSQKSKNDLYYWYRQSDHTYVGSSSSINDNPLGCSASGENCVKGYLRSSQPSSEPSVTPDANFSFN